MMEPMTDQQLEHIREDLPRARARAANFRAYPPLEYVAFAEILLAEVDRLRAELAEARGTIAEMTAQAEKIKRLEADNAALREIATAVAVLEDVTFLGDWQGYDYGAVNEIVRKARALLGLDR